MSTDPRTTGEFDRPQDASVAPRRPTVTDVRTVTFARASMLQHGYNEIEVDRFLQWIGEELDRRTAEEAALREQLAMLQAQLAAAAGHAAPSEEAVRLLSVAQRTADDYVAEAEAYGRQVTTEAQDLYEEQMRTARDKAGAIIQVAQEAAASIGVGGSGSGGQDGEQAQQQVLYLQAFGETVRVQLRAYLEALIADVETEWGRADPAALPPVPTPRGAGTRAFVLTDSALADAQAFGAPPDTVRSNGHGATEDGVPTPRP